MMSKDVNPPIIIVNFKSYLEGLGDKALKLARLAEEVSEELGVTIAVGPQFTNLKEICGSVNVPVFAQHIDVPSPGAYTGSVSIDSIIECGAIGSFLNHSEKRLRLSDIGMFVNSLKEKGLISVVCSDTEPVSAAAAALNPNMVAIEPPELIGTGVAVSKAKPEIVSNAVLLIKKINSRVIVLCGAGITKGEDVESAIKLGAEGVLVASGVVKAKDQKAALYDLAQAALKP